MRVQFIDSLLTRAKQICRERCHLGSFAFEGEHYNYRYVNIWPRLIQPPQPPIWLPGTASMETIDFSTKHNYPYMTVFMPMEQRKRAYDRYRRLAEEKYGYEAQPDQLAFCVPVVIAETDDLAMQEGETYVMWLFNTGLKVRPEFFVPPGERLCVIFLWNFYEQNRKSDWKRCLAIDIFQCIGYSIRDMLIKAVPCIINLASLLVVIF